MWSSVAASGFGDRLIQLAAEPMLGVYEPGASAAQITAGIMFFFFLPYMALTLAGGWLADHLPRKWIMLVCDESRAMVLLLAFFMVQAGTVVTIPADHVWFHIGATPIYTVAKVYLIMFATGCFAAIFNPAKQSTVPQIVKAGHLQQANAVLAGIALIASLIGLQVGGPIVENYSVRLGIMLGVLSYGISGWFFAFLRVAPREAPVTKARMSLVAQISAALTYMRTHVSVRNLVVLNILFWSTAWIVNAAIAALNRKYYGIAVDNYLSARATMLAVLGAGMLAGSFVVLWIRTRRESGIVAMAGLAIAAMCMFGLAAIHSYRIGLILAFVTGLTGGVFLICVDTLTQSITPNFIRGRVFGMRAMLNTISAVAVNLVIWRSPDADRLMIPALKVTAALTGVVALWGLWRQMSRGPAPTRETNVYWRMARAFVLIWHRLRWTGRQHLPSTGPVILAANHTTALDPMLIQSAVPRVIRWVMLKEFQSPGLWFLWRAIKPIALGRGGRDLSKMRQILSVLGEGQVVGVFPEGGLQRDQRELRPFGRGIGMLASRSQAVIVPIWIAGTPRTRRMIWHFLKPSRSQLIIGTPYRPPASMDHQQVADDLRRRLETLSQSVND